MQDTTVHIDFLPDYPPSSSSSALASCKSAVSKPSVNQPQTDASSSRAAVRLPWRCHSRLRLIATHSSSALACWRRVTARAWHTVEKSQGNGEASKSVCQKGFSTVSPSAWAAVTRRSSLVTYVLDNASPSAPCYSSVSCNWRPLARWMASKPRNGCFRHRAAARVMIVLRVGRNS